MVLICEPRPTCSKSKEGEANAKVLTWPWSPMRSPDPATCLEGQHCHVMPCPLGPGIHILECVYYNQYQAEHNPEATIPQPSQCQPGPHYHQVPCEFPGKHVMACPMSHNGPDAFNSPYMFVDDRFALPGPVRSGTTLQFHEELVGFNGQPIGSMPYIQPWSTTPTPSPVQKDPGQSPANNKELTTIKCHDEVSAYNLPPFEKLEISAPKSKTQTDSYQQDQFSDEGYESPPLSPQNCECVPEPMYKETAENSPMTRLPSRPRLDLPHPATCRGDQCQVHVIACPAQPGVHVIPCPYSKPGVYHDRVYIPQHSHCCSGPHYHQIRCPYPGQHWMACPFSFESPQASKSKNTFVMPDSVFLYYQLPIPKFRMLRPRVQGKGYIATFYTHPRSLIPEVPIYEEVFTPSDSDQQKVQGSTITGNHFKQHMTLFSRKLKCTDFIISIYVHHSYNKILSV